MITRMKPIAMLVALLAAASLMAACGKKTESITAQPEPFNLVLDFTVNADHVGDLRGIGKGLLQRRPGSRSTHKSRQMPPLR